MKIFLYEPMHEAGLALLEAFGEVVIASQTDEATVMREADGAEAVVVRANGGVSQAVIDSLPCLKVIGRHGVGVDNIDVAHAIKKGIRVVYTPHAPLNSTAEHAIGLLFALARDIPRLDLAAKADRWAERSQCSAIELQGKTLGIAGMGKIGQRVAQIASLGIGMKTIYFDPIPQDALEKELRLSPCASLEELIAASDFLTLHTPLNDNTRRMMNAGRIGLMKKSAYLINASRGGIVDSDALVEALQARTIAGAALDVFDPEPIPNGHPILSLANVILSPHVGGMSNEGLMNMSLVAKDIIAVLEGREPGFEVKQA